jgi:hypothetical protein
MAPPPVEKRPVPDSPSLAGGAVLEAARLLGVLADPSRMKVAAALSLGAWTVKDVVERTQLSARVVEQSLARLTAGGLVERDAAGYRLRVEDLQAAARAAAAERRQAEAGPEGAGAVVARFVKSGRLTSLPTTKSKRAAVLDFVAQTFTPGRRYPEKKVNEMLARFYDDYAALRRYLVDEGFMDRAQGKYWRSGGTFQVD